MQKLTRILTYELKTSFRRPSFLFITFGIPLAALIIFLVVNARTAKSPATVEKEAEPQLVNEGYIDPGGLVQKIPWDLPQNVLRAYPSEDQALSALEAGEIRAYYIVPADYAQTGKLVYVRPEYIPLSDQGAQDWIMRWTLLYNLVGGDMQLARRIWQPAVITENNLSVQGSELSGECPMPGYTCESSALLRYLPMIILVFFFIAIMTTASLLLQNMSKEKENRLVEILLNSASPTELLVGKVTGLGILGLIQVTIYLGTIYFIFNRGRLALNLPPGYAIPPEFIALGFVFFVLGYAVYAFMMAAAGAMVPDAKSYTSTSMIVGSPLYIGYICTLMLSFNPNGTLATFLSLFPLTSPVVMMWRLVHGSVPTWQLLLAVALLIVTVILVALAVGRMFRAQLLLSGQPFSARRYLLALWKPEMVTG
jgi:ABC-2 type transport system permease protein